MSTTRGFYTAALIALLLTGEHVRGRASLLSTEELTYFTAGGALDFFRPNNVDTEPTVSLTDRMLVIQKTIDSITQQPTCQKTASLMLLESCQKFDGRAAPSATDDALAKYETLYAIRMTKCDLEQAGQSLPSTCDQIVQYDHNLANLIPRSSIDACVDAMYQDSQHWNTFNTIKYGQKNGYYQCHLIRMEADKDEQLHVLNMMLKAQGDINQEIRLQTSEMETLKDIARTAQRTMLDMQREVHEEHKLTQRLVKDTVNELQSDMQVAHRGMESLLQNANIAQVTFDSYVSGVMEMLERASSAGSDVSTVSSALVKLQGDMETMNAQHQYQQEMFLNEVAQKIGQISGSVEITNDLMNDMMEKARYLDVSLDLPIDKVAALNSGVSNLSDAHEYMHQHLLEMSDMAEFTRETVQNTNKQLEELSGWIFTAGGWISAVTGDALFSAGSIQNFVTWLLASCSIMLGIWSAVGCRLMTALPLALGSGIMTTRLVTSCSSAQEKLAGSQTAVFHDIYHYLLFVVIFFTGIIAKMIFDVALRNHDDLDGLQSKAAMEYDPTSPPRYVRKWYHFELR